MTKNKIEQTAQQILTAVGGSENIISAAHCATRLRLVLKDESIAKTDELSNIDLVKGQFSNGGQYQIIVGAGTVNEVYHVFVKLANIKESSKDELKKDADNKMNPVQKLVKLLSDIFVPIIPALVAAGLLMGINNVLTSSGLFFEDQSLIDVYPNITGLANMINVFANAAFVFLPILIGFSATKMFGGNPYLGAVMGMIMVHPDLLNAYGYGQAVLDNKVPMWNVFGLEIEKVGYQGTVFPVLAASFILAQIEKSLRKVVPSVLDNLLTPLLTVFITSFLTFTVVGGFMRLAGNLLADGMVWLYDTLGFMGGAVFGFILAPLTLTGMHHSLLPIDIQLIAAGGSFLLALVSCNNVAQGGATFAAMLLTKDEKMKSIAVSSGISALLGITEPAMFGVNLKMKYPFYAAMLGSALGCAYVAFNHILNVTPGPAGLIGFVSIQAGSVLNFLIAVLISFTSGFVMTIILSKSKKLNTELKNTRRTN
ncbi:sucrose-specific PTS transporter subunit IIBC [Paenibacillus peoriae]|uniref:sucrose-specific PTS transporter subunit IIBC n=1 Tax=Paenibacillus peoriae TaxID=59893 RepID=UPI00026C583D|nr:sucrose-specific PTS transporter subunit IIBC [Paenibacillus peoriae]MEC0182420.1 sucrose-specific PTS transporter subunit IIBC [Paenibacillus peoriae]